MSAKKKNKKNPKDNTWTYPAGVKSIGVALYYGFRPTSAFTPEKPDRDTVKSYVHTWPNRASHFEEKTSILRTSFAEGVPNLPLYFVHEQPYDEEGKAHKKYAIGLDIVGSSRSVADATVIKTAFEAAEEEGYENVSIEINSVGDRDSLNRFTREFITYMKKHLGDLDPECVQMFKKNPLSILDCTHEKCQNVREGMPYPMNFLSEPSRNHFMEVLEFLEISDVPYTISNTLIECSDIALHTVFKIYSTPTGEEKKKVVAWGFRWGGLARKMGFKKDVPGVSATIYTLSKTEKNKMTSLPTPSAYFIHIGEDSCLKSLNFIESLRQMAIPIYHSLTKDKLTLQMASAEQLRVPYILIMGQKESVDGTVLVRRMSDRSQETIRLELAPGYLKKILGNRGGRS